MKIDRTRFLGATYIVGIGLVALAMITGRFAHLDVIITLGVEILLLYISIFRPPLKRNEIGIMILLAVAFYPLSVVLGIFSDMVVVAVGGVAIYVAMTIRVELHPTKALLGGVYSAGLFYLLFLIVQGRGLYLDFWMALVIQVILLYMSLSKRPPGKSELTAISALIIACLVLSILFWFFSVIVLWAIGGLILYGFVRG